MAQPGKARLVYPGRRTVRENGKAQLFNTGGHCSECCYPYVHAQFATFEDGFVWDLSPYQGIERALHPCAFWRIIEVATCFPVSHPWYIAGCVNAYRQFVGLPRQFRIQQFPYAGYLELQVGCRVQEIGGTRIIWPGECQANTPPFSCDHLAPFTIDFSSKPPV